MKGGRKEGVEGEKAEGERKVGYGLEVEGLS